MKDKVLIFIIGLLVGAVITASGFLIYEKTNNTNKMPNWGQMQMMEKTDGELPEKPSGSQNNSNRPELPSNDNFSKSNKNI